MSVISLNHNSKKIYFEESIMPNLVLEVYGIIKYIV